MSSLASWLIAMVGPMVIRAIIAAGFTAVTYTGVTTLVNSMVSDAQSKWSSMPATVIQLASLSGIPEALGMILGALVAVFAAKSAIGFSKYIFKK